MWARIMGSQLVEIIHQPKAITINNVQYPKSIFTRSWTDEQRKALGIVPYVYEGNKVENMFYTSSDSSPVVETDKVVVTRTTTARDILSDGFKLRGTHAIQNANADNYLYIAMADIGGNGTLPPIYGR